MTTQTQLSIHKLYCFIDNVYVPNCVPIYVQTQQNLGQGHSICVYSNMSLSSANPIYVILDCTQYTFYGAY